MRRVEVEEGEQELPDEELVALEMEEFFSWVSS